MIRNLLPCLLVTLLTTPSAQAGQVESILDIEGKLNKQDQLLPGGEWADIYTIELQAGDRVLVEMNSRKVDSYVVLRGPGSEVFENDDGGSKGRAVLDVFVEASGTWMVYATSFSAADKGGYTLSVQADRSDTGSVASTDKVPVGSITSGEAVQGTLGGGDFTLPNGEWADRYAIPVQAGQHLTASMTASDIDTYLVAQAPSGTTENNDDCDGDRNRSCLDFIAQESGDWVVYATSYQGDDDGSYTMQVDVEAPTEAMRSEDHGTERWSGSLEPGDTTISSGEYLDAISVHGTAGERWVLDLRSTEFDPFLIVRAPDRESQEENDDFEGDQTRSLVDFTLTQTGDYGIGVTTYRAGDAGRYDLTLRRVGADGAPDGPLQSSGTLADGDSQLSGGEWYDNFSFEGLPGQTVQVDLQGDFDTYVGLIGPGDFKQENDDFDGTAGSRACSLRLASTPSSSPPTRQVRAAATASMSPWTASGKRSTPTSARWLRSAPTESTRLAPWGSAMPPSSPVSSRTATSSMPRRGRQSPCRCARPSSIPTSA